MKTFDIIVIGAGSGGLTIASFMNRIGLTVLLTDRTAETIGGDCLNFGCVPSKALIHVAREVAAARGAGAFGLASTGMVDMAKVRAYITGAQAVFRRHENPEYLRSLGIEVALGETVFTGRDTVEVGGEEYRGKKIVIAAGSRPRRFALPGAERLTIHSNETIFDIDTLPKKLVLIGGGPVSLEIGQALGYLGSEVSIVQKGGEILPKEEPGVARRLREALAAQGIAFYCDATAQSVRNGNELVVTQGGKELVLPFDALFAAVGRIPNTDRLNLEAAGIEFDGGRIVSDPYLRTTNPRVYVCGDAAGAHQFTHAAELHASVILQNFFSPLKRKVRYDLLSWVTYTDPEVATFGRAEAELQEAGVAYEVLEEEFAEDDRAIIDGYRTGYVRLLLSPKGLLLGGTMLAPRAGELIQELTLAQMQGVPLARLSQKTYPYPVASRIVRRLSLSYRSRQLTPLRKKLLRFLFSL